MISNPRQYIEAFVRAGADHITFHIETVDRPLDLVNDLHKAGVTAGVALNPETDVMRIVDVAPSCELVLVMTVSPGFGGQEFIPETAHKVRQVRELVGPATRVQVDGGISAETAPEVVRCGADTLVVGSAIFGRRTAPGPSRRYARQLTCSAQHGFRIGTPGGSVREDRELSSELRVWRGGFR